MANKLFFSGLDLETCRYVEQILGQNTEYDTVFGGVDDRARTVGRPLMSLDEVRMMNANEGVLISGRQRSAKLTMPPFFADAQLNAQSQKSPAPLRFDYQDETVHWLGFNPCVDENASSVEAPPVFARAA